MPEFPRGLGRAADRINSTRDFIISHRRLPRRRQYLNDYFFYLINSDEILNPLRAFVADKEYVKLYVASIVGTEHAVPTLRILRTVSEAMAYVYPDRCVIKPTHLSNEVILRKAAEDKVDHDLIGSWFDTNWYLRKGGWEIQYRNLAPKVLVEPIIFDDENISDIKLFCSRGRVGMIQVDVGRKTDHRRALFTPAWEQLPFEYGPKSPSEPPAKPANLKQIVEVAQALSAAFSFIRVDMYSDGSAVYVGELTSCPGGALKRFKPASAERIAFDLVFSNAPPETPRLFAFFARLRHTVGRS